MAAPGSLYGEGAQLVGQGAESARSVGQQNVERQNIEAQNQRSNNQELGEDVRQLSDQQAKQRMAQMDQEAALKGQMVTITPQLALGLTKNTGDKEWMTAVGQSMRADVYTALYTHGIDLAYAKKAPKITPIYDGDKVRHAVVYTDEQGNQQQLMLDAGITPEKLHPNSGKKGGASSSEYFKKNQQFIKSFEKARSELSDPARAAQLKSSDPDTYTEKTQWLKDNQDQYDSLVKTMGRAGGESPVKTTQNSQDQGGAPFDANAFIKDALNQ